METDVTIREARADEAASLSDLALRSKAYWGYDRAFMEACREELTWTPDDIRRLQVTVAETWQGVVGFCAIERPSADEAELDALFVEPLFIGRGHGKTLIEYAKSTAAAMGARTMIVQGDPHAEPFYLAVGGRPAGTRASASIPGRRLPVFCFRIR